MGDVLKPPPSYTGLLEALAKAASPKHRWAYLVSYDLHATETGHNYIPFIMELQSSKDWWHYLTNTWIVIREELIVDFSLLLTAKLHSKDRLLVLPAFGPATGWMTPEAWDWIRTKVPSAW